MLLLLACAPTADLLVLEGSGFGHYPVQAAYSGPVEGVLVGGLPAYDVSSDGAEVHFTVQGGAGLAEVILLTQEGEVSAGDFEYLPPADPLFDRMTGIGASLTMGVQDGVPHPHAQRMSPGAQIARQAGAFYGIPLLVDGLFPTIEVEHLGPPPECKSPSVPVHVTNAVVEVLGKLNDDNGDFHYSLGRQDPDLIPRNAAVGGFYIDMLTEGTDDFAEGFLGHLVLDPYGDMNGSIRFSQVDHVLSLDPTLVLSFDTFGNDLIGAVVLARQIELKNITPQEDFEEAVVKLLEQLGASDAQVFLSNSPRPGLLPAGRWLVETDDDPEAAQALLDEADAIAATYNAILLEEADLYDNVYIVDGWALAESLNDEGLLVDGQALDVRRFGGLLSLDGVHFTDVGYAAFANLFVEAIEQELGVRIDPVDLVPVAAADTRGPAALAAAGLDVEACWR